MSKAAPAGAEEEKAPDQGDRSPDEGPVHGEESSLHRALPRVRSPREQVLEVGDARTVVVVVVVVDDPVVLDVHHRDSCDDHRPAGTGNSVQVSLVRAAGGLSQSGRARGGRLGAVSAAGG